MAKTMRKRRKCKCKICKKKGSCDEMTTSESGFCKYCRKGWHI